ncbi:SDR family NAD(P)-dependent oxidoreductase [Neisseria sp. S1]|uniref:SDR family NAD(P)-dependent oxidoreductase n=1 Tax=Neisseria sp. S1 TaxID=3318354 RepID=UPI003A86C618
MYAPDSAILGLGYLGRPLAEKLDQHGSRIAALKHRLTSDEINLPIQLSCANLNEAESLNAPFWQQYWADKPVWFCLLPPSPFGNRYNSILEQWLKLAQTYGIQHIIYGSSISVYGNSPRECDEDTVPDPQTESARNICTFEQQLLDSAVPNIDILRLGGLYSATRHPLNSLLKRNNISGAYAPVNMLHQDRAVSALFYAACNPQGKRIRNLVEPEYLPKYQFYRAEAAKLGLPEPIFDMDDLAQGKIVGTLYNDFAHILTE